MQNVITRIGISGLAAAGILIFAATADAQLTQSRWTLDTGGGKCQGGTWSLTGTIGQPDAGAQTGGVFTLKGGFWFGGAIPSVGVDEPTASAPPVALTLAVTPNPVIRRTTLRLDLPRDERVTLGVYDASGRQVTLVADETMPAGPHDLEWSAEGLAAGVYFVRLDAGRQSVSRKLLVVK